MHPSLLPTTTFSFKFNGEEDEEEEDLKRNKLNFVVLATFDTNPVSSSKLFEKQYFLKIPQENET